jgi:hypothetical protein
MRTFHKHLIVLFTVFTFMAFMMLQISVESVDSSSSDEVGNLQTSLCFDNLSLGLSLNDVKASGTDPEECGQDCEEDDIVCYATFDDCWINCSEFWRCNPNGDCYSVSGKNERDSNTCE